MARPTIPSDDLYARLELPVGASVDAVEVAWRALLKRHHPDIAGETANETAKRINVAHDWLTDTELRARYDRERHPELAARDRRHGPRSRAWAAREAGPSRPKPAGSRRAAPASPAQALARFLDRIERLSNDELDRLSLAESPPIAFAASIARFLSAERLKAVETAEREALGRIPRRARWDAATRDAVVGATDELVLRDFLDEHLDGSFRERVGERLTRGWEAAVDQPRYGPNTTVVTGFVEWARAMDVEEARALARAGARLRASGPPWPAGLDPAEHEGLRVSVALAARDAAAAPAIARLDRASAARARRVIGQTAHAFVLRHAFPAARFDELTGPWRQATGPRPVDVDARAGVRVRRR
jgi:curved DNA-binding protein CbpA